MAFRIRKSSKPLTQIPGLAESEWNLADVLKTIPEWQAGLIGQALYLAAEAAGMRGTGIGCYFDDALHETLGLTGHDWQSLYHFTVGFPVEDERLRTAPPYAHLKARG